MLLPNVYSFRDYRAFLREFYKAQKHLDPSFSFKKFSMKGGIQSPNILKLVMDGEKNLSTTSLLKFAKALDLDLAETEFFEYMVLENQAEDEDEKRYYAKKLRQQALGRSSKTVRLSGKTSLFDHPLMPSMIVFLAGGEPAARIRELQKVLPLKSGEITSLIMELEKDGILQRADGKYKVDFEHAIFHRKPPDVKLKQFLKKQLNLSVSAFDKTYAKNGKFFAHSMGISKSAFPKIVEEIKKMIADVNLRHTVEPAEELVQINIQTFLHSET